MLNDLNVQNLNWLGKQLQLSIFDILGIKKSAHPPSNQSTDFKNPMYAVPQWVSDDPYHRFCPGMEGGQSHQRHHSSIGKQPTLHLLVLLNTRGEAWPSHLFPEPGNSAPSALYRANVLTMQCKNYTSAQIHHHSVIFPPKMLSPHFRYVGRGK